jgi:hypothetical protein
MDPIQEAIECIESREAGDDFSYRQVAKKFGVDRKRCRGGTKGEHTPMQRRRASDNYSTHNKRMSLYYT